MAQNWQDYEKGHTGSSDSDVRPKLIDILIHYNVSRIEIINKTTTVH